MSSDLRRAGINPDHWYVAARSSELPSGTLLPVILWQREIVLFRDRGGAPVALEDRCPHRHVRLSLGRIVADTLECAYHGWRFAASGACVAVPYLEEGHPPPACRIRRYPVIERHGFLWLFPGDPARAAAVEPLAVPEWDAVDQVASVTTMELEAHYSFLVENLMDMHHGHLHARSQAWSEASLQELQVEGHRIDALYDAVTFLSIRSILSPAQLLLPFLRRRRPAPLRVSYVYPHWVSSLGEDFRIVCLLCPQGPSRTKAYLIHFSSLQGFRLLQRLPLPLRRAVRDLCFDSARILLDRLVAEDRLMIEEEQRRHRQNPQRRPLELNPALMAVQRLIAAQASGVTDELAAQQPDPVA